MKVNSGNDSQARAMGGDGPGYFGTATATSATSVTATGTPWVASQWIGHIVVATGLAAGAAGGVYGVVVSNTTSVLTIDRWYNAATPGGAVGTTPGATTTFTILSGNAAVQFLAITANNGAAAAGDTVLTGEITTAGGGLIRQLATYAHTTSVAGYTMTATWTVNASDTGLPVTIAKIGAFNSLLSGLLVFESLLAATAVLSAIGDALTVTHSITN